jgi:translation elongation factor EF-1beta
MKKSLIAEPTLIAKSNVILDVKPWDDETDMKELEKAVRSIVMDGLLWGASKLVPLAYGIHKLQISSVIEDEKVSVDLLIESLEAHEDFVRMKNCIHADLKNLFFLSGAKCGHCCLQQNLNPRLMPWILGNRTHTSYSSQQFSIDIYLFLA